MPCLPVNTITKNEGLMASTKKNVPNQFNFNQKHPLKLIHFPYFRHPLAPNKLATPYPAFVLREKQFFPRPARLEN
jgi:hypothetical protein